jgi:hypothetical protein
MTDPSSHLVDRLRALESPDVATSVRAVEDLGDITKEIVDRVLEAFAEPGPARYLMFERLGRFGSLVLHPLGQLLTRSDDHELCVLAAVALLSLGSRAGVEVLLDSVRADDPYVCLVVRVLAQSGIQEAAARIEEAIYECDVRNTAVIECLVVGIRGLRESLPEGVRARIQRVEPEWLRESLLR